MGLGEHPAIGNGEVTNTVGSHHAVDFRKMSVLCLNATYVFDDVVSKDDIETLGIEWQFHTLHLTIRITIPCKSAIHHVNSCDIAA